MTVQDYLRVFRERWLVILIAGLVGLSVGVGAFVLRPAEYTAQISMYVSAQVGTDPQQAYLGAQLSEQRVKSYTGLITSPRVMKETVSRLGLEETPDELARKVEATSSAESIVIDVAVTQSDPQQAARAADSIGDVFTGVVDDLERPSTPGAPAPVAIRIVQSADVPAAPSSTGFPLSAALGLFAGLVAGAGAVLARNAFDTSVRSPGALSDVTGAPNLGAIAFDSGVPDKPLLLREEPHSPRAEAFRQIRTNLQFMSVDSPRKVVTVTSSMPTEGKSTTVANLAIALAAAGSRVLVIDADLRRPKLAALFGLEPAVGLTRVLSGRLTFAQALQPWSGGVFDVLTSGPLPPNPSELLGSQQMRGLLDKARVTYDIVLLDCPPLLPVTDAAALAPSSDGAVLVCRYKRTTRAQVATAVEALRAVSVTPLGTVFTMVPSSGPHAYGQYHSLYRAERPPSRGVDVAGPLETTGQIPPAQDAGNRQGARTSPADRPITQQRPTTGAPVQATTAGGPPPGAYPFPPPPADESHQPETFLDGDVRRGTRGPEWNTGGLTDPRTDSSAANRS